MRWSVALGAAAVLGLGLAAGACGDDETLFPHPAACTPGAQAACACPGGGQGAQVCRDDGRAFGPCEGCAAGQGGSGGGGGSTSSGGAAGAPPAPECETDEDCTRVMADELAACGLPAPQCRAECNTVSQRCQLFGPFQCSPNQGINCPAAAQCHEVECVFEGTTSSCVYSQAPDGTPCTQGFPAECKGGTCEP